MTEKERLTILENWISQYKGIIFKVVKAFAVQGPDEDDLFQEIIIQTWHSIPGFKQQCSDATWLYRIALNTATKWTKKEKKLHRPESLDTVSHLLAESGQQTDERLSWLYGQIQQLDRIDRSVILLLLDGFSYKEIAGILGISDSNVGVKINRVKKQLTENAQLYNHDKL